MGAFIYCAVLLRPHSYYTGYKVRVQYAAQRSWSPNMAKHGRTPDTGDDGAQLPSRSRKKRRTVGPAKEEGADTDTAVGLAAAPAERREPAPLLGPGQPAGGLFGSPPAQQPPQPTQGRASFFESPRAPPGGTPEPFFPAQRSTGFGARGAGLGSPGLGSPGPGAPPCGAVAVAAGAGAGAGPAGLPSPLGSPNSTLTRTTNRSAASETVSYLSAAAAAANAAQQHALDVAFQSRFESRARYTEQIAAVPAAMLQNAQREAELMVRVGEQEGQRFTELLAMGMRRDAERGEEIRRVNAANNLRVEEEVRTAREMGAEQMERQWRDANEYEQKVRDLANEQLEAARAYAPELAELEMGVHGALALCAAEGAVATEYM